MRLVKKMPFFFLLRFDQNETRNDEFAIKRETFFDLKKHNFSNLTHAFGQKMPIFSLFRFGQNKT